MPDRVVRIVLTGDSASAVRAITQTGVAAERTTGHLDRMHSAGKKMSEVGRSMTELAVPLIATGGYALKAAAQFQDSMTLLRTQVGVGRGEMTRLGDAVKKLAPQVGFGPKQLAEALYPIESVGLRGSHALDALKAAAMGAQVSGASLADTADAVSGALKTQLGDVRSASDAMSIMNGIVAQGKMHLGDLNAAMGTGILTGAKAAGLGFRDVGAALAAMTRQGIPAQDEATRLQRSLMLFEAPKGKALQVLQAIGLKQFSLADDLRKPNGLVVALKDLRAHLAGLSGDQKNFVISTAFGGAKGAQNVVALLNALPMMTQIRGGLNAAGPGQLAKAMDIRKEDLSFKWEQLKASLETALVGLGDSLMPLVVKWLPKFTHVITDVVHWLTSLPKPVKQVLFWFTAFMAIGGPVLMFTGRLVSAISTIGKMFKFLGGPLGRIVGSLFPALELGMGGGGLLGAVKGLGRGMFAALGPLGLFVAGLLWANKHVPFIHNALMDLGVGIRKALGLHYKGETPSINRNRMDFPGGLQGPPRAPRGFINGPGGMLIKPGHGPTPHRIGGGWWILPDGRRVKPAAGYTVSPQGTLVPAHRFGGPVRHMIDGGPIGGYGGGDRRAAMLEDGEFVLRKEVVRALGMNALNAMNQSGGRAGQSSGPQTMMVTMPVTLRIGNSRVLAEEVVRFAARRSAVSGHWGPA